MSNANDQGEAAVPAGFRLGDGWRLTPARYEQLRRGQVQAFVMHGAHIKELVDIGALVPIDPPVAEPRAVIERDMTPVEAALNGALPVAEPAQPVCKACQAGCNGDGEWSVQPCGCDCHMSRPKCKRSCGRDGGPGVGVVFCTPACRTAGRPLNPPPVPPEPAKARKVYDGPVLPGMRFRFANGLHGTVLDVDGPGVRYRTAAGSPGAWCNIDTFRQVATYAPVPPGPVPPEGEPVSVDAGTRTPITCDTPTDAGTGAVTSGEAAKPMSSIQRALKRVPLWA